MRIFCRALVSLMYSSQATHMFIHVGATELTLLYRNIMTNHNAKAIQMCVISCPIDTKIHILSQSRYAQQA